MLLKKLKHEAIETLIRKSYNLTIASEIISFITFPP